MGDGRGGLLISPDRVVPSCTVSMTASDISPYTIKSRRRFLLARAYLGSPGKRAAKRLCVCINSKSPKEIRQLTAHTPVQP